MESTILYVALAAFALLTASAVVDAGRVTVSVSAPPKTEAFEVDLTAVQQQFNQVLLEISNVRSVAHAPELVWQDQTVADAAASALYVDKVVSALKTKFGLNSDRLQVSFYTEDGELRALVGGSSRFGGYFGEILTRDKGEPVMSFMRRCALLAVSRIAPYSTTIRLLRQHAQDNNFDDVGALAERSKSDLPSAPTSVDRSLFDNVLGLVALFKNDPKAAAQSFADAMRADPTNPVPFINASFADLQENDYEQAAQRMDLLVRLAPPEDKVLLSTAYMTWGAALMGLHQLNRADEALALAAEYNPQGAAVMALWAEEKRLSGDETAAARLEQAALGNTPNFENYAEVAALYFQLAWQENTPVTRSKFDNPPRLVTFH